MKLVELVAVLTGVVTLICPVLAPPGTVAMICVSFTTVNVAALLPNFTRVVPVKALPAIVTSVPCLPLGGEKPVIAGAAGAVVTVKLVGLVAVPAPVVTEIVPVVAPEGTVAVICVLEPTVKDAEVPLNATADAPVKLVPLIVTSVPTGPLDGVNPLIAGAEGGVTVKLAALVPVPAPVVTEIVPLVAPEGTVAVICVLEPTVNDAVVPLNVTD